MKKAKPIISTLLILAALGGLGWGIYSYLDKHQPSLTVCQAPGTCKTILGAEAADIKNLLGSPAEHHRAASVPHSESEADFLAGYFDEKLYYFRRDNKVFWIINAKIRTGFFEDAGQLVGADAKSFEIIDANFSKDKKHVWGRKDLDTRIAYVEIIGADPASFSPLDFPYAKDKQAVYYLNHRLDGANAGSFQITENKKCGQDGKNYYKEGQIATEADCL
jgi:hypothetical protein